MYVPRHFEINDTDEIFAFIENNAFGQLISTVEGRLFSTHLPVLLGAERDRLLGHLARANPQWKDLQGQEVLITLQGPHDYISPAWYSTPGVPTWNYQALHVYGTCQVFDQTARLKAVVDSLTDKFETNFDEPWKPEYQESMLKGIVGIEVIITEIQCKFKLNQNRSKDDQSRVSRQLEAKGAHALSRAMNSNER